MLLNLEILNLQNCAAITFVTLVLHLSKHFGPVTSLSNAVESPYNTLVS